MPNFVHPDAPVVAVYNNLETFYPFLRRARDPQILNRRRYHGDRGLFWLGKRKLVFTTAPVPMVATLCDLWGYTETRFLSPRAASPNLSLDILAAPELLAAIVDYAGAGKTIQVIPYATTLQFMELVAVLRERCGLTVLLPECPAPEVLWLRDYIDSKAGFRVLAAEWLAQAARSHLPRLPYGLICPDRATAAGTVNWLASQGKPAIVKASRGESGLGQLIFEPEERAQTTVRLAGEDFLEGDWIVVEEYIRAAELLSPSIEFFVPPPEWGGPEIAHVATQIFRGPTQFCGALLSKDLWQAPWFAPLAESGLLFGRHLQEMGYRGHFDLDCVIADHGEIYLLEINARRTGSTFIHDFGKFALGPAYLDRAVLLSNTLSSGAVQTAEELLRVLEDLLYRGDPARGGVVISNTSALPFHEFGSMIVASSSEEALRLQAEVMKRIY